MASTTALFTGLSGLNANARHLDVIGDNISNVNTTAFKSSRMLFQSMFARTLSAGTQPTETAAGSNPTQIGLGVAIAGTQRDFSNGALSTTGDVRDLAIEGDGFFMVRRGQETLYTRAGAFRRNSENELTTITGERLRGFGVDDQFNVVRGELVDLSIPVGQMTIAEATRNVRFTGNLNANGSLPTRGSLTSFQPLGLLGGPLPSGDLLEPASPLTQVRDGAQPAGGPLFVEGQILEMSRAEKGTRLLPDARLPITADTTVEDLLTFLTEALGIETSVGPNPNGRTPGAQLDPATGLISIVGNTGTVNSIRLETSDLRMVNPNGTFVSQPLVSTTLEEADGEAVRTTFVAYDSLGTPVTINLTLALDSRGEAGTTWRYFAESNDDTDLQLQVGNGTLTFDTFGQLIGQPSVNVLVNRTNTGAVDPLSITLTFASDSDNVTSLTDIDSRIAATFQDGAPLGTLTSYGVGASGLIVGAFTNGLTRTLGQIALASFTNPEGLVSRGANLFEPGANSGLPIVTDPLTLGTGRVVAGALELSNVDLSQEFVNLILASTGYSASSRVITTTDQLIQQLLVIGR